MKRFAFIPLLLLFTATAIFAQDKDYGTPEERAQKMTQEMAKQLPLTEAEVAPVKALNLKYAKIIQAEVIDQDLGWWSSYRKIKKINTEKEAHLKALLSESQYKNYEGMKKAWSKGML